MTTQFSGLSNDDFADVGADFIAELEARVGALPTGADKTYIAPRAFTAHQKLYEILSYAKGVSWVASDSGGDPK